MTENFVKYGQFSPDSREFIIHRLDTPRPWINYAWNSSMLISIDQRGQGYALHRDAEGNRSKPIRNRFVYIKDGDTGEFWTIGWGIVKLPMEHYCCHHGLGYSVLKCNHRGIMAEWSITASGEENNPVELWEINLYNDSDDDLNLTVYPGVEFDLGGWEPYGTLENYSRCSLISGKVILAVNSSEDRAGVRNNAFFAVSVPPSDYETRKHDFLGGAYSEWSKPAGICRKELAGASCANEEMVGIFQYSVILKKKSKWSINTALGPVFNISEAEHNSRLASPSGFAAGLELAAQRTKNFDRVKLTLPDLNWQRAAEIWNKQQLMFLKDYTRIFLVGFRDILQDAQALCPYQPDAVVTAILTASSYQFSDGSAMRGWCPLDHHKYGDSGVWLPMTVAEYLRETGNFSILNSVQKYFDKGSGTIWQHTVKAIDWLLDNRGEHGLPKLFFGDWNDSLNIGLHGRGESVWLGMALVVALRDGVGIAKHLGDTDSEYRFNSAILPLKKALESCWDGNWYQRGYDDDGRVIGSVDSEEGNIFSEPQSWAYFAGMAPERLNLVAESVDKLLRTPMGLKVCHPPFSHYQQNLGRITTIPPGWGENGSCYCHVTAFQAVADCLRRNGNAALATLNSIAPFNRETSPDETWLEPYAFSNMFRGLGHPRAKATFKGWTSGTVPWVQRCITHYLLGVRPDFDGLYIDPVIPAEWDGAEMVRQFRQAEFRIKFLFRAPGAEKTSVRLRVNGKPYVGNFLPEKVFPTGVHHVEAEIIPGF